MIGISIHLDEISRSDEERLDVSFEVRIFIPCVYFRILGVWVQVLEFNSVYGYTVIISIINDCILVCVSSFVANRPSSRLSS